MRFLFVLLSFSLNAAEPKKVETYTVQAASFKQPIQLVGTLKAHREAILTAGTSGILTHIFVKEGALVQKDQILAALDNESSLRKSLGDTKVRLYNKKKRLKRIDQLQKQGDLSLKDLEDAQNELADTQKSYHDLEHQLSNTEFKAPFKGQCGLFKAEVGSHVASGSVVVAVYDTSSFSVSFSVPENLLSELKIGQKIKVQNNEAVLSSFENRLDPKTHTAHAKATLNKCPACVIGAKVPVLFELQSEQKIVSIPSEAVFLKNASPYVYKIVNQKAVLTPVKTGERAKKQIAVLEGLKTGDVVILRGQSRIQHDDPVH
ncbi:MAG: efflux RND transporter periplasmic adaptor subunit [Myxococcaceae bacterium]